jgi:hypothetical protein
MIGIALILCEILGGRGALSVACNFERKDVIVGPIKILGIETVEFEARALGIDGIAFSD